MQALAVKFFIALGYKAASALASLAWSALYEAFTDKIVEEGGNQKNITQEERREVFKILEASTDREQRRHLMSVINKLR